MSLIDLETLVGRTVAVDDLTTAHRRQMYELLDRYYEHVTHAAFEADLADKRWVVLAVDSDGTVQGFSTQRLVPLAGGGRALFSGDTVVDRPYWGRNPIAAEWGRLALEIHAAHPDDDLYWFLIAKGYKTYRLLATYFRQYYPRLGEPTPDWASELIDELAGRLYAERYDPGSGIIVASAGDQRLRVGVAPIGPDRLDDPIVMFFDRCNPGHRNGDELCCVARLDPANLNEVALALIGAG